MTNVSLSCEGETVKIWFTVQRPSDDAEELLYKDYCIAQQVYAIILGWG